MTSVRGSDSRRRFDRHEWRLVVVSFLVISVVFGCGRFTYPTVITPMRDELGVTRETMALLATVNLVGYLLGSVLSAAAGRLAQGLILPALSACAVCIAGLLASSWVWLTAALLGTLGFSSGVVFVAAAGLLSTRFQSDRGRAVGLAMAGIGGGIVVSSGLSALLLPLGQDAWRVVWGITAVYAAGVALAATRVYARGGTPAHRPTRVNTREESAGPDRRRWFLFAAYLAWGFGQVIQITLLPEFLVEERGISAGTASLLYGASGVTMILASPLVGQFSDSVGRRVMYGVCLTCSVAAVGLVVVGASVPMYLLGSLLFGIPVSGIGALTPSLVADLWRPEQFAAVFGGMTALFGVIQASGPSMAALSIVKTGSLQAAYVASLIFCAVALVCVAGLPSRPGSKTGHRAPTAC